MKRWEGWLLIWLVLSAAWVLWTLGQPAIESGLLEDIFLGVTQ